MSIEIGSLVVRGTFGTPQNDNEEIEKVKDAMTEMRMRLLSDMEDMIAEAERRRIDR